MTRKILRLIVLMLILSAVSLQASPRNMLPRFPELIIEKGLSEHFKVTSCDAKVKVYGNDAESSLKVTVKNQGADPVESSVKFRILYPTSENQVRVSVNGRNINYRRDQPRHTFTLAPEESIVFDLSAKVSINYSIDSVRKALREQENDQNTKKRGFLLEDLTSFFEREKYGRRFMVGPLVSKWGVFPVDFAAVSLEIEVPDDFTLVATASDTWQETRVRSNRVFKSTAIEGFAGAVFLPATDREEFLQTQKILSSEKFMH
ncbi:MAG TPA: hypothetical protein PLM07_10275 [Candidatus Rifleibacterium sp.]|nr:hypothetical protein [Candidatus Rifleibacterium sp.]HPT46275.1 hypothetical protein [Candidatus Rifleibacterium sp.]